jgi:hypothetical protein
MAVITFTKRDVEKSKGIENGWYKATIESAVTSPSQDRQSINRTLTLAIHLPTIKDKADYPTVKHWFNSKGMERMIPFICAMDKVTANDVEAKIESTGGYDFDFEATAGRDVIVKLEANPMRIFDGKPTMEVKHFVNENEAIPF